MSYYQLPSSHPVPIWYVNDGDQSGYLERKAVASQAITQAKRAQAVPRLEFRGVPIERFSTVLATGVDVEPTDSTIYCAEPGKAWEYAVPTGGGHEGPGMIYVLDRECLQPCFRIVSADASLDDIAEARKNYPHQFPGPNGSYYFSRPADAHPGYDMEYGYWVPGNARDALLGIFVRGRQEDVAEALKSPANMEGLISSASGLNRS